MRSSRHPYEERAEEVRTNSEEIRDDRVKLELLLLSSLYEKLAALAKRARDRSGIATGHRRDQRD